MSPKGDIRSLSGGRPSAPLAVKGLMYVGLPFQGLAKANTMVRRGSKGWAWGLNPLPPPQWGIKKNGLAVSKRSQKRQIFRQKLFQNAAIKALDMKIFISPEIPYASFKTWIRHCPPFRHNRIVRKTDDYHNNNKGSMLHPGGRPTFSNTNLFLYLCCSKKCYKVMYLVTSVGICSFDEKEYAYNITFVLLFHFYLNRILCPKPPTQYFLSSKHVSVLRMVDGRFRNKNVMDGV